MTQQPPGPWSYSNYGGPPPGPPAGYPPGPYRRPTNTMAILSLIFAFIFSPLGIVFGVIAKRQIRDTGEDGAGLATAGLVVGAVLTGLFVLFFVVWVVAVLSFVHGIQHINPNLPPPTS
ncbi:MAG: DUF4190 domain-containing protein [Actinomycetota bacterium]|nr:DUF4190 domain-containing protein [Actinomycetota bacterium]